MDKMLANYLVQSLEILENHTVSQIRALKGLVLSAQKQPTREVSAEVVQDDEHLERKIEDFFSDLSGVEINDSDIRESEEADR